MQTKVIGVFAIDVEGEEFRLDGCPLVSVTIASPGYGPNAIWLGEFIDDVSAAGAGWRHELLTVDTDWDSEDPTEQLIYDDRGDMGPTPLAEGPDAETAYRSSDLDEVWSIVRKGITKAFGTPRLLTGAEAEERDYSHGDHVERVGTAVSADLAPAA